MEKTRPESWTAEQWEGLNDFLSRDRVLLHPVSFARSLSEGSRQEALEFLNATAGLTFSETLLRTIDDRGRTDVEVYKKAKVDRRVFSRLRSSRDYQPSRSTAIRFCLALRLTDAEALTLLEKAGFTLSAMKNEDLVVLYCLKHCIDDLDAVDDALRTLGFKPL